MKIVAFAMRNIGRNSHRTVITTLAMAFAGFIMVFYVSLVEGMFFMLEKNVVSLNLGDLQIHAPGYRDDPDLYNRIEGYEGITGELDDSGFYSAGRLFGFALAATGRTSSGVVLRGVDVEREATVTDVHQNLIAGSWLDETEPRGVVLGSKLAKTLEVGPGDEVVIVGQASDGSMANELYRVRGILKSLGQGIDGSGFFMVEREFRSLMVVPTGVHEIVAMRKDRSEDLEAATERVRQAFPGLDVRNWRELQPLVARIFEISNSTMYFMYVITYAAIGMVILNAMLMSVFERIHEFGLMKAVGVGPLGILALVLTEAGLQAAVAGGIAVGVGLPFSLFFESHGIDLSRIGGGGILYGVAIDPVWYCRVTARSVIEPIVFLFAIVIAGVVYPATKAALITPLQAVYYR